MSNAPTLRHTVTPSDSVLEQRADALVAAQSDFMDQLVALRERHDLTQQHVADLMGISQSAVSKFEREDSNPTVGTLRRYALAVGARFRIEVVDDCVGQADPAWDDTPAFTRIIENLGTASPSSDKSTTGASWDSSGATRDLWAELAHA